jgi:hypothetical protein
MGGIGNVQGRVSFIPARGRAEFPGGERCDDRYPVPASPKKGAGSSGHGSGEIRQEISSLVC